MGRAVGEYPPPVGKPRMEIRSLPMFVRTRSRTLGPKPALRRVAGGGDQSWTWADTWAHARTLALALLDEGLVEGEPVILWAGEEPEALFAEVGLQAAGALAVCVPLGFDAAGVSAVASALGVRRLLAFGPTREALDEVLRAQPGLKARFLPRAAPAPVGDGARLDPWSDDPRLEERLNRRGPDSLALALVSVDGHDTVQGRILTQGNLLGVGLAVAAALGAGEDDAWWVAGPWRGAFPRTAGVAAAWLSGGELILAPDIQASLQVLWRAGPTIAVLPAAVAASLARQAADEVERAQGLPGRMSRWMFRNSLREGPRGLLDRGLAALVAATGAATPSEVVGGRLTRVLADGPGPAPESVRLFRALGVSTWTAVGNDVTAGVATLERLPAAGGPVPAVPGTRVRREADGEVSVQGVAAAPPLGILRAPEELPADRFYRTGLKGHVAGNGVTWDDL